MRAGPSWGYRRVDRARPPRNRAEWHPVSDERDTHQVPTPSLWPIGFAIGVACVLVGLVVSVPVLVVGAIFALVFGFLWVRDLFVSHPVTAAAPGLPDVAPVATEADLGDNVDRATFLSLATIAPTTSTGTLTTSPTRTHATPMAKPIGQRLGPGRSWVSCASLTR